MNPGTPSRLARWLDLLRQDLAFAFRGLRRNPGFAATALGTLALGIGASAAMFSVVNSALLRPLPYARPDELVLIRTISHRTGSQPSRTAHADVRSWREASRSFAGLAYQDGTSVVIQDSAGLARRVSVIHMSANLFEVLGVPPLLGRGFTEEEVARREPLAVLGYDFWQQELGGDPAVLDRTMIIEGQAYRLIGVASPATRTLDDAVLWLPASLVPGWDQSQDDRGPGAWSVLARLAPGVSLASAQAELTGIAARLERDFPATNLGLGALVEPLDRARATPQQRLALLALVGAVGAVLLIACSNVASLLLARGSARQREFAIRLALGASRRRVVIQLLLENTVLALLAAAAGTALALAGLQLLRAGGGGLVPRAQEVALDGPAVAFAAAVALASAAASGLWPALRSTDRDPMTMLRGGRGLSETWAARRTRALLVMTEFALSVVLLAAALLLVRSLARLTAVESGFQAESALLVQLNFPRERPEEEVLPFVTRVLEELQALPGVDAAGVSEEVMLDHPNVSALVTDANPEPMRMTLRMDSVTEGYFAAAGVPLRRGRLLTAADDSRSERVVIVNETLAQRLWPDQDPIGRRLRVAADGAPWETVVGVAGDLRRQGADREPIAQLFRPLAQVGTRSMMLVLGTAVEPTSLLPAVRAAVARVDRNVPVSGGSSLQAALEQRLAPRRFTLGLIGAFAVAALGLAGVGIFGLMTYSVARRTQEIGVRMALGAEPAAVLRMVLGEGFRLAVAGIGVGLGLSLLLLPRMSNLLFGVGSLDPISLGAAAMVLLVIALLASLIPARRAVAVDPVNALRAE